MDVPCWVSLGLLKRKLPLSSKELTIASQEDVVIFGDDDALGVKCGFTSSIVEFTNGYNKGILCEVREKMGTVCSFG